jgi:hypothetical protein
MTIAREHAVLQGSVQCREGVVGMTAKRLGEEWEGAQIDGTAQLREALRKLARQSIFCQPPAICGIRAAYQGEQWYKISATRGGVRRRAHTRAKRWAHRRSPISGMVPNNPKPPKLMSHSSSGQSTEQCQLSKPLGGHDLLVDALAASHLNVTLSAPAASAAANCEKQVRHMH